MSYEILGLLMLAAVIIASVWYWTRYLPSATREELEQERFEKDQGIW